jgi:hypothetical protein
VRTLQFWLHLCGRCLFFAGSQLLRTMEDPAAAAAPGLSGSSLTAIDEVRECLCDECAMIAPSDLRAIAATMNSYTVYCIVPCT